MNRLIHNAQMVDSLGGALREGEHGLHVVPGLLRKILEEGCWRERVIDWEAPSEVARFSNFREFLVTEPPKGLGHIVDDVLAIVKVRNEHDILRMLHDALKDRPGPSSRNNVTRTRGEGNRRVGALDRLHRDRPDLYECVVAGELSANAAAVEAGFRKRTATVPVDTPEAALTALRRRFTYEQLREALDAASP